MRKETKIQMILTVIGFIFMFLSTGGIGTDRNSIDPSVSFLTVYYLGFILLFTGIAIFLYGLAYPYLEAWRFDKKRNKYSILEKNNL